MMPLANDFVRPKRSIGTAVVRRLLSEGEQVVNLDKLTYGGSNPPLGEGVRYVLEVAAIANEARSLVSLPHIVRCGDGSRR